MESLTQLYEERSKSLVFKRRNLAYRVYEAYYDNENSETSQQNLTWRPRLIDGIQTADEDHRFLVNYGVQVVKHWSSMFSRVPRIWNKSVSSEPSAVRKAGENSSLIAWVMRDFKTAQPRQSFWLSVRGDACYGVDWDFSRRRIMVRGFDPLHCYPTLNDIDVGGVDDILIHYRISTAVAEATYGYVRQSVDKDHVNMFIWWDAVSRRTEIENQVIQDGRHNLGFCPFRWVFANPSSKMAESDLKDVPVLQDLANESLELALDSLRKNVDLAYYGVGIPGDDFSPEAGMVKVFTSENARVEQFPTAPPPDLALSVMRTLREEIQGVAGISPISMEGVAGQSQVSGSAVRHQVEAIEARAEVKRVALEACFAKLGELILRVLEKQFPSTEVQYLGKEGQSGLKGSDVKNWFACEAMYGGFMSLDPTTRVRVAQEGLGRIWDDREAISIANLDGVEPEDMIARIDDYQMRQAIMAAKAQVQAQGVAQESQGSGAENPPPSGPGGGSDAPPPPESPQRPKPPGPQGKLAKLGDLQNAIAGLKLEGAVWAVGEIAITGMSQRPLLVVEKSADQARVQPLVQDLGGSVAVGEPGDMPAVQLT